MHHFLLHKLIAFARFLTLKCCCEICHSMLTAQMFMLQFEKSFDAYVDQGSIFWKIKKAYCKFWHLAFMKMISDSVLIQAF